LAPDNRSDPLTLALEVLDGDEEEFPHLLETLFARDPSTGLPMWWAAFHPYKKRPWENLAESRDVLLELLERSLPMDSLRRPLSPSMRQKVAKTFFNIASELRSMGFDTPGDA
jgi:hypothetical protein